jgi:hypothetical protein
MGFSFPAAGRVKRAKACSTESHTINAYKSPHPAAKTKEKLAGENGRAGIRFVIASRF